MPPSPGRAAQILWSVILLGCAGWLVTTWIDEVEDLDVNPRRYTGPVNFGIFVGVLALLAAAAFLVVSRLAPDHKAQR